MLAVSATAAPSARADAQALDAVTIKTYNIPAGPLGRTLARLSEVFRVPVVLGLLSAVGLIAALIEDGWFDGLSSAALAIPLIVIAWHLRRRST